VQEHQAISRFGYLLCPRGPAALRAFSLRPAHRADNAQADSSCLHAHRDTLKDKNWSENRGSDRGLHDIRASRNGGAESYRTGENLHSVPDTSAYRKADLVDSRGNILLPDSVSRGGTAVFWRICTTAVPTGLSLGGISRQNRSVSTGQPSPFRYAAKLITSKFLMTNRFGPCIALDKVADGGLKRSVDECRTERIQLP
jgi:hypothetical protein